MENKYIPGDWVLFGDDRTGKVYVKIDKISQSEIFTIEDCGGNIVDRDEDISPIPLTPEILEKNGWEKCDDYDGDYTLGDIHFDSLNYLRISDDVILTNAPIRYVHELQHLLFGLGINSEMEV